MNAKKNTVFGIRALIETVKSGKEIDKVLIKKGMQGVLLQELVNLIKEYEIPFQYVPIEKINRICKKNHQGVFAFVSSVEYQSIESIIPGLYEAGKVPFLLILEGLTDTRNLGAIARTAECAGVDAIIVPTKGSAQINPETIKTSAGALHSISVCRSNNLRNTILFLKESGIQIIAASEKAEKDYYQTDFTIPTAIIVGSEDKGITASSIKIANEIVKIPIFGKIESLNVTVATSIIVYETVRQRYIGAGH